MEIFKFLKNFKQIFFEKEFFCIFLVTLAQFFTITLLVWVALNFLFLFFVANWLKFSPKQNSDSHDSHLWVDYVAKMWTNYLYMDLKDKLQSKLQKNLLAYHSWLHLTYVLKSLVKVKVRFLLSSKTGLPKPQNIETNLHYGAFTLDVKSVLNENLGGILGGTRWW